MAKKMAKPTLEQRAATLARLPSSPSWLLHITTFLLSGVVMKRSVELLMHEQMAWFLVAALAFGGLLSLVLRRHASWLQMAAAIAAVAALAGAVYLKLRLELPLINALEWMVVGLLLAQGMGACRLRHYALMQLASFALVIAIIRHLGALPLDMLVPLILLGVTSACLLQGSAPAEVERRRATRSTIPWAALALRISIFAAIAWFGSRVVARHIPTLREETTDSQTQMWVTYVRANLGLEVESRVPSRIEPERQLREMAMLARNTEPAMLDLTQSYPREISRRLLYILDTRRHVYLRTTVLDHYSGLAWAPSMKLDLEPLAAGSRIPPQLSLPERLPTMRSSFDPSALCKIWPQTGLGYELAIPVTGRTLLRGNLERVYRDPLNNLYSNDPIRRGLHYEVLLGTPNLAEVREVRIGDDEVQLAEQYLQLPSVSPKLITHCQAALDGELRRLAAVQKLVNMVKHEKTYTRNPITLPGNVAEATEFFLFEMQKGSCVQYASSLAVACRIVGIPARVALGYLPSYQRTSSMLLQVRERDAHAWTQVWFPNFGWVDFDATPGGIDLEALPAPDQMHHEQMTLRETAGQLQATWQALLLWTTSTWSRSWSWLMAHKVWPLLALTILVLTIAVATLGGMVAERVRWWLRWRRADRHAPRDAALLRYECMLEHLRRFGFRCDNVHTPDELVQRAAETRYPWAEQFAELTTMVQRLAFGAGETAPEELAELRRRIEELQGNLRPPPKSTSASAG